MKCLNCKKEIKIKINIVLLYVKKRIEYNHYIRKWKENKVNGLKGANLNHGGKARSKYK